MAKIALRCAALVRAGPEAAPLLERGAARADPLGVELEPEVWSWVNELHRLRERPEPRPQWCRAKPEKKPLGRQFERVVRQPGLGPVACAAPPAPKPKPRRPPPPERRDFHEVRGKPDASIAASATAQICHALCVLYERPEQGSWWQHGARQAHVPGGPERSQSLPVLRR